MARSYPLARRSGLPECGQGRRELLPGFVQALSSKELQAYQIPSV